ncbi:Glucokinase [Lentibacillus sp. JNUCC-1]|uniref:ROK family protein n=1 Tax=Lentibacillus sp. JNUCC-1 TaxID=2654513 RepID=UPI0012E97BCC|nr:ROK family protein [Lentibacillus sp. JNUCC-1]MUV37274.1 Glucokinase [Lentibacillus sp. JNUCC-1]
MKYSIGVDIGGTKVAIAAVDQEGQIEKESIIKTDQTIRPQDMIARINAEIKQLLAECEIGFGDIKGIGIGAPGPLNVKKGEITCPPNLPAWRDIPIVELVKSEFNIPVRLENDANAAALAEKWIGAGKGFSDFIYMTVSTGIGAGVIVGGDLLKGQNGNAGDIGHMVVDPAFGQCTCGQEGCLELVASGTAIARKGSEIAGRSLTTAEVFDLYHEGEPEIVAYINLVFKRLAAGCVSLINTFDTEAIVIGGGVSKVGEPLFSVLRNYVAQYALNPKGRQTEIIPAKLEQSPGVIGAAALWFELE